MTTLAVDKRRDMIGGDVNELPVIASEIIYEGAAVGAVKATGLARPLQATDKFIGFAITQVDNSTGAASAKNVRVYEKGKAKLSVSGAVITDIGQPVYASDDDTFVFNPVGAVFIGYVHRFVSSGVVEVAFDSKLPDPYGDNIVKETISANKTLDAQDSGKTFFIDTDAVTITLPAIADGLYGVKFVNIGAFGTVAVNISPNAADAIQGSDAAAVADKDLINTKATAQRGDFAHLILGDADGYGVTATKGIWAAEG